MRLEGFQIFCWWCWNELGYISTLAQGLAQSPCLPLPATSPAASPCKPCPAFITETFWRFSKYSCCFKPFYFWTHLKCTYLSLIILINFQTHLGPPLGGCLWLSLKQSWCFLLWTAVHSALNMFVTIARVISYLLLNDHLLCAIQ